MQATAAAKKATPKKTRSAKGTRTATAEKRAPVAAPAPGERHQNEGHGRRLTMAFEALEAFPALAESRNRLLAVIAKDNVATADVVSAVESDVALIIAVLRLANRAQNAAGKVDTAVAAVELLSPQTVQAVANRVRTFDFFERASVWDAAPERFRLHALATQHAADRLATEVGYENRDRLTVTSLLHDVGKLVLLHAYPGYPVAGPPRRPHARGTDPRRAPRARRRPRTRRRRADPPLGASRLDLRRRSSATTTRTPRARPPSSASPTCSPTTSRAAGSARPSCCTPHARSASARRSCAA